ncbi:32238_t:CDS:1, partial [Racocetra persica]
FLYKVIKEGTYPNKSLLAHTLPPNKYPIPDDYTIETTWGRGNNQCTIRCSINYNKEGPVFYIYFGKYFEYEVFSIKTATDSANLFHK